MRICLVAANRFTHDRRATALARSLRDAGNEVEVAATAPGHRPPPPGEHIRHVPSRFPSMEGPVGSVLRRVQPQPFRDLLTRRALSTTAAGTGATLFQPTSPAALEAAVRAAGGTGAVIRDPRWPSAGPRDLIDRAPLHPGLSESPAGPGLPFHTPGHAGRPRPQPEAGRLTGTGMVMVYRKTHSNPGRYLESALRRAGADVRLETDGIDWATVDPGTRAVVFVEGPYPAMEVRGENPGIPVVFWAHHGEHHVDANVRLCRRYGAHAQLLAHSWHLSHRFGVPVTRFPFGMDTGIFRADRPFGSRAYDVAMVGAYVRGGGPYTRRGRLVAAAEEHRSPERCRFEEDIGAEEMAAIYAEARIVLNEGGTRHFPITMRVLETVGSGALLLSDRIPGMDLLLTPGEHYLTLEDDLGAQLDRLFADPGAMERIARAAFDHSSRRHTYDHRVDDLMEVVASVDREPRPSYRPPDDPLAALVDRDVEVQRVIQVGAPDLDDLLPDREVWDPEAVADRLRPGSHDAVAVRIDGTGPLPGDVLRAARRYVYAHGDPARIRRFAAETWPGAEIIEHGDLTKVDLWAPAYRLPRSP